MEDSGNTLHLNRELATMIIGISLENHQLSGRLRLHAVKLNVIVRLACSIQKAESAL